MYYLVYKITNKINGKYYIGVHQTTDKHDDYMGSGDRIRKAIKKYGKKNFSKQILFEAKTSEEMYEKEKELVVINSQSYNIQPGGNGGFDFINDHGLRGKGFTGKKHTGVAKEKISISKLGNTIWVGRKHSEDTKELMSKRKKGLQKGKENSQFGTMWITNGSINKKILSDASIPNGWKKGRVL